eukprot:UN13131
MERQCRAMLRKAEERFFTYQHDPIFKLIYCLNPNKDIGQRFAKDIVGKGRTVSLQVAFEFLSRKHFKSVSTLEKEIHLPCYNGVLKCFCTKNHDCVGNKYWKQLVEFSDHIESNLRNITTCFDLCDFLTND